MQNSEESEPAYGDEEPAKRRVWPIVVSVAVSAALTIGYVTADAYGALPASLQLTRVPAEGEASGRPVTVSAAGPGLADVSLTRTVDAAQASDVMNGLVSAPGMGSSFSAVVLDAEGHQIAAHDPTTPREPASTMKTLTALAAATSLDMGSRFTTSTYLRSGRDGDAVLTLRGNGDMLLGHGENDPSHVVGRAGLASLADRTADSLRSRGLSKVALVCDDSLFGDVRTPAGLSENDPDNVYFTGISSVAVDGGRQRGGVSPADPDNFSDYPRLSQTTARDVTDEFLSLLRARNIDVHLGSVPGQSDSQGVAVKPIRSVGTKIGSVHSATLGEVLGFALRHSDNTLAEEFGRLVALKTSAGNSPEGATHAVLELLNQLKIDTKGLTMADCCGLSPGSRVQAKTLAQIQTFNVKPSVAVAAGEGLSIPGLVGTAEDRLADGNAAGLLRVKTGSLDSVTAMSGNVSRSGGGVLTFAVIVNDPSDMGQAKEAINTFVSKLAGL